MRFYFRLQQHVHVTVLKVPCARDQDAGRSPALRQRVTIKKKLKNEKIWISVNRKYTWPRFWNCEKQNFSSLSFFYRVRDFLFNMHTLKGRASGETAPLGEPWHRKDWPSSMPGSKAMRLPTIVDHLWEERWPWPWPELGRFSSRFSAVSEPFLDPNGQKIGFWGPETP
jgi:hypothetical protein